MTSHRDITLIVAFSGTPHPQHREDIRRAFDALLDSIFEHSADSGRMSFNVGGSADCRLFRESASWIGLPVPVPVPADESPRPLPHLQPRGPLGPLGVMP